LGALLHAAALDGRSISDLMDWVRKNDATQAANILTTRAAEPALGLLHQLLPSARAGNTGEQGSIWSALTGALSAFDHSAVTARAEAAVEADFDAVDFLSGANALFVVAPSDASSAVAPFVVGLVEEIRVAALRICDTQPGAALPVPLLLALDEVVNIAPLPSLPEILRECGGRNIVSLLVVQNLVAADRRWGRDFGSRELFDLCGAVVVLPGVKDGEALKAISGACGTHWVVQASRSRHYHRHHEILSHVWPRWPAVRTSYSTQTQLAERARYSPGEIRQLPRGHVLALVENLEARTLRIRDFDRLQPFRAWARLGQPSLGWWSPRRPGFRVPWPDFGWWG
ncbi:MAG: type IV secretory system conjugative DNA transfer family protein, partial [Candidatus Dormibacteria bacterium]